MKKKKLSLSLTLIALSVASSANANVWTVPNLHIGKDSLPQTVTSLQLTKGVTFYKIVRGQTNDEGYLLSSGVLNDANINSYVKALKKQSIDYSIESVPETSPKGREIGKIVRIHGLADADSANALAKKLGEVGLNFTTRFSAQDGYESSGPFDISLLRVDLNKYDGKIKSVLANDKIPTRATVTAMSSENDALAAINGGYFAFSDEVGDDGAPAGIYVRNGKLLCEAANHRPVLIVDNSRAHSKLTIGSSVTSKVSLVSGKEEIRIDGLNRKPGIILNCGGYGDMPVNEALHDFVCTDDSEIIVYNSAYGDFTPKGDDIEIVVDKSNKIVNIDDRRGRKIQDGKQYIQLTGNSKLPFKVGDTVKVDTEVVVDGNEIELNPGLAMINAGPSLVTNFEIDKSLRKTQGFDPYPSISNHAGSQDDDNLGLSGAMENREGFYNGWVLRRHPRTAIGYTEDNVVYAAVVFGI